MGVLYPHDRTIGMSTTSTKSALFYSSSDNFSARFGAFLVVLKLERENVSNEPDDA